MVRDHRHVVRVGCVHLSKRLMDQREGKITLLDACECEWRGRESTRIGAGVGEGAAAVVAAAHPAEIPWRPWSRILCNPLQHRSDRKQLSDCARAWILGAPRTLRASLSARSTHSACVYPWLRSVIKVGPMLMSRMPGRLGLSAKRPDLIVSSVSGLRRGISVPCSQSAWAGAAQRPPTPFPRRHKIPIEARGQAACRGKDARGGSIEGAGAAARSAQDEV